MIERRSGEFSWWMAILAVNVLFIGVTLLAPYPGDAGPSEVQGWMEEAAMVLHLGREMNVGVWWSGLLLVLLSVLCYELFSTGERRETWPWACLAFLFAGFAFDELGSVHERVFSSDRFGMIFGVVAVGGLLFLPAFWRLLRSSDTRRATLVLIAGLMVTVSAVP